MAQNKKKTLWIILILVLLLGGGGGAYAYYYHISQPVQAEAEESAMQTSVARQGDLSIYASGAGTVIAATERGAGFDENGTLIELLVAVGDVVDEGQVLARLQTDHTAESIALEIANAELNLLQAQKTLDDLVNANISLQLAQAQLAVLEAQTALEDAQDDRARMEYPRCSESTLDDYESEYYALLDRYNELLSNLQDVIATRDATDPIRLAMEAQLEALEEQVQAALINVNWCSNPYSDEEKAEGDARVSLAQAELFAAQAEVESWMNYPDPLDVAVAEAKVTSAEAALADAQETQLIVDLVAPIGGTVLNINGTVGEDVGTSAIITIADLAQPMLQVYLDETDFDKAIVGYVAEVTFDAYPDDLFTGQVVQVDPSLSNSLGASLVVLLVQLDPLELDQPQRLPLGMSATVDIIAGRATNAVLVPVEAVRDLGDGTYAVFVMENEQPVLRVVTIGITDLTYIEITSGLSAGETVTTGIVETK
jgi:HlyD family secretion protein